MRRGEKDLAGMREGDTAKKQRDMKRGSLRDYGLKHKVTLYWDMNEDSTRDMMCRLLVDDYEVILDAEELLRYLRWM